MVDVCYTPDLLAALADVPPSDVITSFFEDETSDEPWLVIVEPC